MANICWNTLTVHGPAADVDKFINDVYVDKETALSFNKTVPIPEELKNSTAPNRNPISALDFKLKYGHSDWYDWSIANWGTKWDAYEQYEGSLTTKSFKNGNKNARYEFSTAWSPPTEWYKQTSKLYPNLTFVTYCNEPGMGFKGTEIFKNGVITKSTIK